MATPESCHPPSGRRLQTQRVSHPRSGRSIQLQGPAGRRSPCRSIPSRRSSRALCRLCAAWFHGALYAQSPSVQSAPATSTPATRTSTRVYPCDKLARLTIPSTKPSDSRCGAHPRKHIAPPRIPRPNPPGDSSALQSAVGSPRKQAPRHESSLQAPTPPGHPVDYHQAIPACCRIRLQKWTRIHGSGRGPVGQRDRHSGSPTSTQSQHGRSPPHTRIPSYRG